MLPPALLTTLEHAPDDSTILLLGDHALSLASAASAAKPRINVIHCPPSASLDELRAHHRCHIGIISDMQAWPDKAQLEQQLATLRDHTCEILFVGVSDSPSPHITRADCLALGLRGIGVHSHDSVSRNWYKYSIIEYKQAPDWLNADNWAHPGRWGQERW